MARTTAAILALQAVSLLQQASSQCTNLPHCICDRSTVACRNETLENLISEGVPADTTSLRLSGLAAWSPSPNHQLDFTALHAANFSNLTRLVHLTLTSARIKDLIGQPFLHVTRLQSLNLSHNAIEYLSAGVFNGAHTHLRVLDLSNNFLTSLKQPEIFHLPHLRLLNVGHNLLNEASFSNESFSKTHVVATLVLDGSQLPVVNDTMFNHLDRLQTLSVRNCRTSSVHIDFQYYLTTLTTLHLGNNEISKVEAIQLSNAGLGLRSLHLDHNRLDTLPADSFSGLNLHTLSLSDNNISSIDVDAFVHLQLKQLNLSENKLDFVENGTFTSLSPTLLALNLASNGFRDDLNIPAMQHLKSLNLSRNALSRFPDSIHSLPNLQSLDVSCNQLTTVNPRDLELMLQLDHVNLHNNSWKCDCRMYEFYRQWTKHREPGQLCGEQRSDNSTASPINNHSSPVTGTKCIICSEPNVLAGHSLDTLAIDLRKCALDDTSDRLGLYVLCGVILFIIAALLAFMWTRRNTPISAGSDSTAMLLGRDRRSSWIWELLTHRRSTVLQNTPALGGSSALNDKHTKDQVIETISGTTTIHANKNLQVYVEPSSEQIIISNPVALSDTMMDVTETASPLDLVRGAPRGRDRRAIQSPPDTTSVQRPERCPCQARLAMANSPRSDTSV